MSVSNNIAFKNRAEKIEAIDDYRDMLKLRADLNQRYEKANKEMAMNQLLEIKPGPPQIKTAEEESKDQVLQNTKAFDALKLVMKEADASTALSKLQNDNEVVDFNRFSTLFMKEIKDQKNITPMIFDLLWARYKEKLLSTDKTGIVIGAERGEYEDALDDISDAITSSAKPTSALAMQDALEKMERKDLDKEFSDTFERKYGVPLKAGDNLGKAAKSSTMSYKVSIDPATGLWLLGDKRYSTNENAKIKFIMGWEGEKPVGIVKWTGPFAASPLKSKGSKPPKGAASKKKGTGLQIDTDIVDRMSFGDYYINLRGLNRGYLHLLYPCGKCIGGRPRKSISPDLVCIFIDILVNEHFDENDYDKLDDSEKKIFDDTLEFCGVSMYGKANLFKHKRADHKEKKEDIKRFNVLKGQILAGNDNPQVGKELKALILKMLHNKTISNGEANKAMFSLMYI